MICGSKMLRTMIAVLVAVVSLAFCQLSMAIDRITLRSGEVLEGRIEQELNGYIWFTARIAGIEQSRTLAPDDILRIERDVSTGTPATGTAPRPTTGTPIPTAPAQTAPNPNVTRGVVLSLGGPEGDMVGLYMAAKPLREAMPWLIDQGVEVVVFHVASGNSMLIEIDRWSRRSAVQSSTSPSLRGSTGRSPPRR